MTARAEHEERLRDAGRQADEEIDLADTALAMAALDRPRVGLERYRQHLADLADRVRQQGVGAANASEAAEILREVLALHFRYDGDRLTYDDMQNANLMRVIDRRKGLPVALAILYVHAGRAAGWEITGLGFPAHFLVRLDFAGGRALLDPFNGGAAIDAAGLRLLTKRVAGEDAEIDPSHLAPLGNRDTLLRLQNNIFTRDVTSGRLAEAGEVLHRMLLLAPARAELHRQDAVLKLRLGNLGDAIAAAERYGELADDERQRREAAVLLQEIRRRLN